jgi:mRNA interferase MazF
VVVGAGTPSRGDLVWISLTPQAVHEQAGRRPALVLSPEEYNERVGLALMCPITNRVKGYPFEVTLPDDLEISGVVLADQIKSLDWRAREAQVAGAAPEEVTAEVLGKLNTLLC